MPLHGCIWDTFEAPSTTVTTVCTHPRIKHGAAGGELWPWVSVPFARLGRGKGQLSQEPSGRQEGALHPLPAMLS